MKYRIPKVYKTNNNYEFVQPCQSGIDPVLVPTCLAGPEASSGGCADGAAALGKCLCGSAVIGYK